jgi:hypothetical protein
MKLLMSAVLEMMEKIFYVERRGFWKRKDPSPRILSDVLTALTANGLVSRGFLRLGLMNRRNPCEQRKSTQQRFWVGGDEV